MEGSDKLGEGQRGRQSCVKDREAGFIGCSPRKPMEGFKATEIRSDLCLKRSH